MRLIVMVAGGSARSGQPSGRQWAKIVAGKEVHPHPDLGELMQGNLAYQPTRSTGLPERHAMPSPHTIRPPRRTPPCPALHRRP